MKNRLLSNVSQVLTLVLIAGIAASGIILIRPSAAQPAANTAATQFLAQPADANADGIAGIYNGQVALKFTVGGVYSDTLVTPAPPSAGTPTPADVGQIDLSLFLSQSGAVVNGYVNLDKTLVFSTEHTIQATPMGITPVAGQAGPAAVALKIGPTVQGSFDGTNLDLQSERVTLMVSGRSVQRQFRLTGTLKPNDANTLIGEYRETLWGYAPQPLTVLGTFTLSRPVALPSSANTGNAAPLTVADSASTPQGAAVTLNVLANDSDANGDVLTITSVSVPQHGTATTDGRTVTYTPAAGFAGLDTFSYVVGDGKGGSAVGSVTIQVIGPIYLPLIRR